MRLLGYVVVEYNQAPGRPSVVGFGELYDEHVDAETMAEGWRRSRGERREEYAVAEVRQIGASS